MKDCVKYHSRSVDEPGILVDAEKVRAKSFDFLPATKELHRYNRNFTVKYVAQAKPFEEFNRSTWRY